MSGLTAIRQVCRGDRGGVGAIVTILFAGGVLLGATALVVDVGRLYAEKAELQNGADAASMAVAEECGRNPGACAAAGPSLAAGYADGNATDGAAAIQTVCGRGTGTALAACPPASGTACVADPPAGQNYVEVRTATRTAEGESLLPPAVAQALAGDERYDGTEVTACARAAWGPPRSSTGVAVTVSTCEWAAATGNGSVLPLEGAVPTTDTVLYLHGSSESSTCPAGPSGWDAPGGFGWLDDTTGECSTTVGMDGAYGGDTGVSPSHACKSALAAARAQGDTLLLPIYDGVHGSGSHTTYHLAGLAAFVLTGYSVSGFSAPSTLTGQSYCTGSNKCLYGYFIRALVPAAGSVGGTDYGATVVTLVG